ncbi:phosphopantothenoylcysteine decarboxylase-like [Artemia franciscana]|uniref:Phosphopantothenoylcysteine decarboxylase n=1 Tax=Artemia franciscana TaxID=6661 RepID=A0AA88KYE8_ARTSF|nr:hypothetical protein QYM36_016565 [Artemia franciscana]
MKNVLVGCTGSVASIKVPFIVNELTALGYSVRLVATENAKHFFSLEDIDKSVVVYSDKDEWDSWKTRGDPVLHIELRKWADLFLIAPLDANTLGKLANGLCDNLLTCVARAWDLSKPLLFAPAMNTMMWEHPVTKEQIDKLVLFSYKEIKCVSKVLMCGESGNGAMADYLEITKRVSEELM